MVTIMKTQQIESQLIHGGTPFDSKTGAVNVPIYQTSTYQQAELGVSKGYEYSRTGNPTREALEKLVAELEHGVAGFAFASGMAAITAVLSLLRQGDRILISSNVYGGTFRVLDKVFLHFGITYEIVDTTDVGKVEARLAPDVKAVLIESPANPLMTVTDIAAVAAAAKKHGVLTIVDNTFMTPYLQRPLDLGADIVVHSATKYIGGHGTTMGGVVVEGGKFPWDNGKFPEMVEPSRAYHGVKFYETFGDFGYTMKARMEVNRTFGAVLSPMSAWQLLQGTETLHLRMREHCRNALKVAQFLQQHPKVRWVNYPGLPDSPYFELAKKQFRTVDGQPGASGILTFGIEGGAAAGERFIDACEFLSHLANIGDAKTLVIHPASTTHRQLNDEELAKAGVSADMVRLSVGIEDVDDILWDIDQALERATRGAA